MYSLKQIVTKASFATVMIVASFATDLPAKADSYTKKCTRGANNSVSCTTTGSGSSSSSTTSGSSSTRSNSSSTRTNTNVNVNVTKKDVENLLLRSIFGDSSKKPAQQDRFPKIPSLPNR